jgi:LEA14-like dessication related protein
MFALSAAGCAPGGQATEPPEVVLFDIVPQRLTLFEEQLRVDVQIRNFNNAPLAVTGLKFNLDLNGVRLI